MPEEVESVSHLVTSGTYFASPSRTSSEEVRVLAERALADPVLSVVLQAVGGYTMVLDKNRQVIAANDELLSLLRTHESSSVLGLRPGEVLNCVNAKRGPSGCGTSIQCRHCGAVAAILAAQVSDKPIDGQCAVACCDDGRPQSRELHVRVTPLPLRDESVYVFVFYDITAAKRRELLERVFMHDLGNLLGGLIGWSDELSRAPASEAALQVVELANRIGEYLDEQRLLLSAESGTLQVHLESIPTRELARSLRNWFATLGCSKGRRFLIDMDSAPETIFSDRNMLMRVLGNLVKNAFEATPYQGTVTLRITQPLARCVFEVHNAGAMAPDVAARLFKQHASTKGPARGLGLYAVQLFGEQYLGGQVTFSTDVQQGTVFRFTLPQVAVTEAAS